MPMSTEAEVWHGLAILGPTASGKSAVALALAACLNGEIISCDSMQVYRGLDIGTAKPSATERRQVRHHLVDICDISQRFSAAAFADAANAALHRTDGWLGKVPILAGGTGLYARTLVYGQNLLPSDPAVYRQVLNDAMAGGDEALYRELADKSGACAEKCRANPRRLYRAVEVLRLTGLTPGALALAGLQPQANGALPATGGGARCLWLQIILMPSTEWHHLAIRQRTRAMLKAGWIDETRELCRAGLAESPTARQALGYRDIINFLGGTNLVDLEDTICHHTIQYARRQRTWFRHQHPGAIAIACDATAPLETIAKRIAEIWRRWLLTGRAPVSSQVIDSLPAHIL